MADVADVQFERRAVHVVNLGKGGHVTAHLGGSLAVRLITAGIATVCIAFMPLNRVQPWIPASSNGDA
jgi:hypothetical protein